MRLLLPLVLLACGGSEPSEFPSVLAPLEDNRAPWPEGTESDPFPETLEVVSGGDDELWWAHARGFVHAPAGLVWEVASEADTVVDRREVDEWEVTSTDAVEGVDRSMVIRCTVNDVLTITYDLTWVHELQEGSETAPERVVSQWDVTGTPFIELLTGSMVLEPVEDDPTVTSVELVEHLKAPLRDDETIASYLRDLHASLVARAHDEPLPVWPAE